MATSVVPALIDALVAAATTALPNAHVSDGFGRSNDIGDHLMIGVDNPDAPNPATSAASRQDWEGTGSGAPRDEEGEITCAALAWDGDSVQKTARDAAYAMSEALAALCGSSLPAGIPSLLWTSFGTVTDLTQDQNEDGAMALLVFQIHFRALLY